MGLGPPVLFMTSPPFRGFPFPVSVNNRKGKRLYVPQKAENKAQTRSWRGGFGEGGREPRLLSLPFHHLL